MDSFNMTIPVKSISGLIKIKSTGHMETNHTGSPLTQGPAMVYRGFVLASGVLALLFCIIGILMNCVIINTATKILNASKRKTQHMCILSMAVADLVFTCVHCPITFFEFTLTLYPNEILCTLVLYIANLSTVASSISLLFLNLDKFLSLRFPLLYPSLVTRQRGTMSIVACWILAIAWATFFVFGPFNALRDQCQRGFYELDSYTAYFIFVILAFILPICISLCISIYVYALARRAAASEYLLVVNDRSPRTPFGRRRGIDLIQLSSHKSSDFPHRSTDQTHDNELQVPEDIPRDPTSFRRFKISGSRGELKTAVFVFSTTVWSFSTSIPYRLFTLAFYNDRQKYDEWMVFFQLFAYVLIMSNPVGNPFVTCLVHLQYRARIKDFWVGKCPGIGGG